MSLMFGNLTFAYETQKASPKVYLKGALLGHILKYAQILSFNFNYVSDQ